MSSRLLDLALALTLLLVALTTTGHGARLDHLEALHGPAADTLYEYVEPPSNEELRRLWIAHYSALLGVDSALALQVSKAENISAVPDAWSHNGCCVGVMQIHVRHHYGKYADTCDGNDLLTIRDNVCYGVAILRDYLAKCQGGVECALARYNGATTDSARLAYLDLVDRHGTAY